MSNHPERFEDPGISYHDMATHFIVHCPKCDGKATVMPNEQTWRLTCGSCFHVETEGHWYGQWMAYVSVKCRECHEQLTRRAEVSGEWAKLKMKCENCGDECEYEAHLSRYYRNHGLMCDAHFGLPLWLQKEFRQDLFWAFNYEHLQLLEDYIRARHRERGISPRNKIIKNKTLVSRLPAFISKAGNRDDLLKLIKDLAVMEK